MFSVGDLVRRIDGVGVYRIHHINKKGYLYLIGMEGQSMHVCKMVNVILMRN